MSLFSKKTSKRILSSSSSSIIPLRSIFILMLMSDANLCDADLCSFIVLIALHTIHTKLVCCFGLHQIIIFFLSMGEKQYVAIKVLTEYGMAE